jgi:hypothetical protein
MPLAYEQITTPVTPSLFDGERTRWVVRVRL